MHILVTNDDGPPSSTASPYVLPFIQALQSSGHTVSVVLPHTQRSWIGKAHIVGQDVLATHYYPPARTPQGDHVDGSLSSSPAEDGTKATDPWVLVNSTPATCAQLGLGGHFFNDKPPIDLVISGPNYGRNTTALFALSSGTLGAALEASVCGAKAIALSFAFFTREQSAEQDEAVREACGHAVRVCESLARQGWQEGAGRRLFSVNVPVQKGCGGKKVVWTKMFDNTWGKDACFQEVKGHAEVEGAEAAERELRQREEVGEGGVGEVAKGKQGEMPRHFKWAPSFTDLHSRAKSAGEETDIAAINRGETSVTALRPAFDHIQGLQGEVKL